MALAMQHFDQLENEVAEVAPTVERDGFSPQDHMVVQVDTPITLPVLEVALVGPQGEALEVNLEDCKTALASRKVIPARLKVVPVRVVLVGNRHTLVGPKVVPGRVVLVGRKHIFVKPKVFPLRVVLVG